MAMMDGIAPPEAEAGAEAGPGVAPRQGRGVRGPGGVETRECNITPQRLVLGEAGQRDREALWPRGGGAAVGAPRAVGRVGALCAHGGQGIRARGRFGQASGARRVGA